MFIIPIGAPFSNITKGPVGKQQYSLVFSFMGKTSAILNHWNFLNNEYILMLKKKCSFFQVDFAESPKWYISTYIDTAAMIIDTNIHYWPHHYYNPRVWTNLQNHGSKHGYFYTNKALNHLKGYSSEEEANSFIFFLKHQNISIIKEVSAV